MQGRLTDIPKVSVITVVLNGAKHLEQTILSVLDQNYPNLEHIIIDGGSTDGTIEIIKKYEDKLAYWRSEKDQGLYDALNRGLMVAQGDWVLVLGADDRLLPNVKEMIGQFKDKKTAYYGNVFMKSTGQIFAGPFSAYKLMYKNISHQSIFYPKSYYKKEKYDLAYRSAADYVYLMKFFADKRYRLQYLPYVVAEYNDIDGISSKAEDPLFLKKRKSLIKKFFPWYLYWLYALRFYFVGLFSFLGLKRFLIEMRGR